MTTDQRSRVGSDDVQVMWFGLLALLISWAVWLPLVFKGPTDETGPSVYLHLFGSLGPAIAAFLVTAAVEGKQGLRVLWRRMRSGPGRYVALAVLGPAAAFTLAAIVSAVLIDVDLSRIGASQEFPELPKAAYLLSNLVFFGYGEEVGWRGFALPRLQRRRSALGASMVLAGLWGVWHLPLFWFSAGLGSMALIGVVGWAASIITGSVVCTWFFNASRGSIAVVAVFHAALDVLIISPIGGEIVPNVMGAAVVVTALVIPRRFGRENLAPLRKVTET